MNEIVAVENDRSSHKQARGQDIAPLLAEIGELGLSDLDSQKTNYKQFKGKYQKINCRCSINILTPLYREAKTSRKTLRLVVLVNDHFISFEPLDHDELGEKLQGGVKIWNRD